MCLLPITKLRPAIHWYKGKDTISKPHGKTGPLLSSLRSMFCRLIVIIVPFFDHQVSLLHRREKFRPSAHGSRSQFWALAACLNFWSGWVSNGWMQPYLKMCMDTACKTSTSSIPVQLSDKPYLYWGLVILDVQHFVCSFSFSAKQEMICFFFLWRGLIFPFWDLSPLGVVGTLRDWLTTVRHKSKGRRRAAAAFKKKKKKKKNKQNKTENLIWVMLDSYQPIAKAPNSVGGL